MVRPSPKRAPVTFLNVAQDKCQDLERWFTDRGVDPGMVRIQFLKPHQDHVLEVSAFLHDHKPMHGSGLHKASLLIAYQPLLRFVCR
jgi:hypothetical protein